MSIEIPDSVGGLAGSLFIEQSRKQLLNLGDDFQQLPFWIGCFSGQLLIFEFSVN
jgi:hypothetical protein